MLSYDLIEDKLNAHLLILFCRTDNNDWSSGTDSSSQPNQSPSAQNSNTGHGSGVRVGGIAGGVAGVFFIGGLIAFFYNLEKEKKKFDRRKSWSRPAICSSRFR